MDDALRPAKITDRFLAYVIDIFPFVLGFYASLYVLIVRLGVADNTVPVWRKAFFAWGALYLAYQTIGNITCATVGKRLLGIGVVRADGGSLGLGRSLLRAGGYLLSSPLMNLGFLWSLIDRDSRAWHDILAGSLVVEIRGKSQAAALVSAALSFSVLLAIAVGNIWYAVAAPTPADHLAIGKAREGLRVLAAIEQSYKAERGAYTESLVELARQSGDVAQFREAMGRIFEADGFVFIVDKGRYRLSARAKDRRRTRVTLLGPPQENP